MTSTQGGLLITDAARIFQVSKTNAADAGDITLATVSGSVLIESITAKTVVTHANLDSIEVVGGASDAVIFITAAIGVKTSLDGVDKQVAWTGAVELGAAKTIICSFLGAGAGSVTILFTIKYRSVTSNSQLA